MCARYNAALVITIVLHAVHVASWEDVARLTHGALCHASSHEQSRHCTRALRGKQLPGGWNTVREGVGSWLEIDFDAEYVLTYCRLMQRFNQVEQSKDVRLSFSYGINKSVVLSKRVGNSYTDYSGQHWDEFRLDNIVTSYVRLDITSVYSAYSNGFVATEFYTGQNPCLVFYTYVQGRCYRYDIIQQVTWSDAQEICEEEGGELASLESPEELELVSEWLEDAFDIEAVLWLYAVRGDNGWHWKDPSETWFEWSPTENLTADTTDRAALKTSTQDIIMRTEITGFLCESVAKADTTAQAQSHTLAKADTTAQAQSHTRGATSPASLRKTGDGSSPTPYIVTIVFLSIIIGVMIVGFLYWQYRRHTGPYHKRLSTVAIMECKDDEDTSGPSHMSIVDSADYD